MKKSDFRKECLKQLKEARRTGLYKKERIVLAYLYMIIRQMDAKSIMLYLPLEIEVNLYPLIMRLRQEKRALYVPFMEGKSFRLVKYRLPLEKKEFGIKEPKDSRQYRKKSIDLAIVPIVGLDITLRRVGFGKGMYDRFFEKEIKNIDKTVFVARKLCYSHKIITDDHDVQADIVIVP